MKEIKGITEPELLITESSHPAYIKAAEYFNIKPIIVKLDSKYEMSVKDLKRKISPNTVVIVASAPGFPHGIVDPIEAISEMARAHGTLCHVDACLGGFILPFARKLGSRVPPFDFSLNGTP